MFLLFFIKSFVLISAQSATQLNPNQQCTKTYLCHPNDPRLFLQCVPNKGMVKMECQHGLLFNTVIKACDLPQNSDCLLNVNINTSPNSVGVATGPTLTSREPKWNNKQQKTTVRPKRRLENAKKEICDSKICKLPNCKCPDESIPGSLRPKTVPQIVLVSFDDAVNIHNIGYYRKLHNQNLTNPDGCPIGLTFFVSGPNNNFNFVGQLYRQGHEIASHSKTHRFPISWWSNASYKDFENEIVGMRDSLSKRCSIPLENLKGIRVPFLQLAGDNQYRVLKDNNFIWDSSMFARTYKRPIWPFTLDYPVTVTHCQIIPCPKETYPGLWEVPLNEWRGSDGQTYAMPDENKNAKTKDEMFTFFRRHFEVHYNKNRAPFGIFLHSTWFKKKEFNFEVLQDFLKYLTEKNDVWVIPVSQAIDWVRNPKPIWSLSEIPSWNCSNKRLSTQISCMRASQSPAATNSQISQIQQMYLFFLITFLLGE